MGFSDQPHSDKVLVQPRRDYTLKEVSFASLLFSVQPHQGARKGLQAQFRSTDSTVYRTNEELLKALRKCCPASFLVPTAYSVCVPRTYPTVPRLLGLRPP